jgi:hypothetical protein
VKDPLEPVAFAVHLVLWLTVTLVGLSIVGTIFWGGSLFGVGDREACVEMPSGIVPVAERDNNIVMGVQDGVRSGTAIARMCASDPTPGQRILNSLTKLPTFLVLIGALLLASRLVKAAGREGIFTMHMAGRLRVLGWFVLVGALGATLLEAQMRMWLANTMLKEPRGWGVGLGDWDVPVMVLFLAAVLISMARIMRISTAMREDLEGTV